MKYKVLLLILVVILVVAICMVTYKQNPANTFYEFTVNPDFMYSDYLYTPLQKFSVGSESDTDLLRVTAVSRPTVNNGIVYLGVFFDMNHPDLVFTYDELVDGLPQSDGSVKEASVECYSNGMWDMCPMHVGVGVSLPSHYPVPSTISAGETRTVIGLDGGTCRAGYYRFTIYFFELDSQGGYGSINTRGERHYVSFVAYIPDISYKPYEVSNVSISICSDEQNGFLAEITPKIKSNKGTLYLDSASVKLEKRKGRDWEVQEDAFCSDSVDSSDRWRDATAIRDPIKLSVESLNADYRLTLHFTEHPDGTGEQYTLTLNLRFDE